MRDIKFRAWNYKINKMFKVGDEFATTHDLDCVQYFKEGQSVALLQYTGLKDKNGVEIYEGDLLVVRHSKGDLLLKEKPSKVYFSEGCFELILPSQNMEMYLHEVAHGDNVISASHNCEVVGNIYENPELLES